jgi:hypothetical protein
MATFTLMIIVGLLAFAITPWIGYLNHHELHHTDLMAGDE